MGLQRGVVVGERRYLVRHLNSLVVHDVSGERARQRCRIEDVAPHGGKYVLLPEGSLDGQARAVERVQRKLVAVRLWVVPGRAGPVVAEVLAAQLGVLREGIRVLVETLTRPAHGCGPRLASADGRVRELPAANGRTVRVEIDQHPVAEPPARRVDPILEARVAVAREVDRHIEVVVDQYQRVSL
jgi:hypothetical protein